MGFLQNISAVWRNVSLVQRALLIAIVLTFVIAGALLTRWMSRPDMGVLYSSLDPEDAGKVTDKISEKNIVYELRNGGTTIYVPKKDISQLRLDMAKEGLPSGSQGGYKIFDDEKIGISPFVQNVNLKRALQEELAKSIQMIEGVAHARVHIVNTRQTLFSSKGQQTTASVVLRLRAGFRLSAVSIAAVTHLVAGAVEGLKSENVTVVDSQGRLLSSESDQTMASGAGSVADYKERVEQNLTEKVEDLLIAALGPGRAAVTVSAIIDMNSINTVTETYDPIARVASKEEMKTGTETGAGTAAAEGQTPIPGSTKEDETIVTEYKVSKTVEQRVELPGEIKSLQVAALVDLSVADANGVSTGGAAAKIMAETDVKEIIRNALGLKDVTGITVKDVPFYRPLESLAEEEESGGLDSIMAITEKASLGIMAICALLVLKLFSGAKKKAAGAVPAAGQLPAGGEAAGLLPAGEAAGSSESLVLRKQIANTLQSNPEQVKQLFASWLQE
ncbi:MAG: flagellar basal-body MS-ring/collar protein FliF [Planctomycetota bacterium]|jgi:flagellar M-ring protein FliF